MKLLDKNRAKMRKTEFIGIRVTEEMKLELIRLCDPLKLSEGLEQILANYINYSKEIRDKLKQIK